MERDLEIRATILEFQEECKNRKLIADHLIEEAWKAKAQIPMNAEEVIRFQELAILQCLEVIKSLGNEITYLSATAADFHKHARELEAELARYRVSSNQAKN